MNQAFNPEEYDRRIRQTLPYYEDFYRQVTDILKADIKHELSWLDIGCGTGKMYEAARELPLREFVFTDSSAKMLDIARGRFEGKGTCFERMSALELAAENRYDVITAIQVNHYFTQEERETVLTRCHRALKNEGFFFTFENTAPESELGRKLFLQRWRNFQVQNGKSQEEAGRHMERYGKQYFPITVREHLALLKSCGFAAAELVWMSYIQAGFMGIKAEPMEIRNN